MKLDFRSLLVFQSQLRSPKRFDCHKMSDKEVHKYEVGKKTTNNNKKKQKQKQRNKNNKHILII